MHHVGVTVAAAAVAAVVGGLTGTLYSHLREFDPLRHIFLFLQVLPYSQVCFLFVAALPLFRLLSLASSCLEFRVVCIMDSGTNLKRRSVVRFKVPQTEQSLKASTSYYS